MVQGSGLRGPQTPIQARARLGGVRVGTSSLGCRGVETPSLRLLRPNPKCVFWGLGFKGLGNRVWGLEFRVQGLGF